MAHRVLLFEQPRLERPFLAAELRTLRHEVIAARSLEVVAGLTSSESAQVVLLHVVQVDDDILATCREIRRRLPTPIIVLCESGDLIGELSAFGAGADHFLAHPFTISQLIARMDAITLTSRNHSNGSDEIGVGALVIFPGSRQVMINSHPVKLSKTQFEALKVLASCGGAVLPHQQLLDSVWGHSYVDIGAVHILMHHLRKRIEIGGPDCPVIVSVPGVGYRLEART